MSARRFAILAALALFAIFVAANLTANSWFRAWRLDLTENHLYSLSRGTQQTLNQLTEPVELTLYYSRDTAASVPQLQTYASRVREMLQTFQARSHGRVRFREIDVEPFSEQEDEAVSAGIDPLRPYQGADPIYFGLTGANSIDDRRTIAFFHPQREAFLEYELTRLIYELENPDSTRVAVITSLPIDFSSRQGPASGPFSVFATEMQRLLEPVKLDADFTSIPENVDVLAIIYPWALTQQQLYAIDQFILRKGRAFVALDPAALQAQQRGFDPFSSDGGAPTSSTLEPLLARWGVSMAPSVVLDLQGALPVPTQDPRTGQTQNAAQPLFFQIPAAQLDREDLMTAWLQRGINFGLAGGFNWSERQGVEVHALARTSGDTMRMPAATAMMRPSPYEVMSMWPQSGGRIETVALRLTGNLETAFPDGAPASQTDSAATGAAAPQPQASAPALTRSVTPAEIVLVADTDFLADDFYVDPQSGGSAADNASFALNAIDVLGGSDALVSLRSRAPSLRRMKLVDDMEADAERRIQRQQEQLQQDLQEAESRLEALQARGRGSGFFSGNLGAELTPEENAEIERFRARVVEVRGELRTTERRLRGDIDRLEAAVVFVNVWLAPLLVAGAGLFLFWRRQRRTRGRG